MNHDELTLSLKELRLNSMAKHFGEIARVAEKDKKTFEQYLSMLTSDELDARSMSKVKKLILRAKMPLSKDLVDYEFKNREGITIKQINRLCEGEFIKQAGNIVFYGSVGVGKTHLALGLVKRLCEKKISCLYTSTNSLIEKLIEAKSNLTLGQLWKRLDMFELIACDELGYIPQSKEGADLFFQFISQRYERKSLLITTNLTYSEWDKVFLNPITTEAAVDRIIHNCETFNITGQSWRSESARKKLQKTQ